MKILETYKELVAFTKKFKDWACRIAIGYIRVSSREQAEGGFSLQAQMKYLSRYAEALKIPTMYFFSEQESAKQEGRQLFNLMLDFYRKYSNRENCPFLLVEKMDRMLRNDKDKVLIRELVDGIGLTVHYVKANHIQSDESGASQNLMLAIMASLAAFYIENLAEEVVKGMKEKAELGLFPTHAPIGYLNTPGPNGKKVIVPDPIRAPLIKTIYEWFVYEHKSLLEIQKLAKSAGLTNRKSGNPIPKTTINNILRYPVYAGFFYWKGIRYDGLHDPIISLDLYERAQALLAKKAHHNADRPPRKGNYTFSGILWCGYCNYAMVGELRKEKYLYYHCTAKLNPKCPNQKHYACSKDVESQALDSVRAIQIDEEILPWVIASMHEANAEERALCDNSIKALHTQLARNQDRLDKLLTLLLDLEITDETYKDRRERILVEQSEAEKNIRAFQELNPVNLEDGVRLLELVQHSVITYKNQEPTEKRKLLKIVHSNLKWRDGKLVKEYRQPFDILADAVKVHVHKKAASTSGDGLRSGWLSILDSNG